MQLDVGSELRRVRESQKLSLRTVASAVGVSASLLSQVETGKTQPSVSTLYALVNYLGMSLDGLLRTAAVEAQGDPDASSVPSAPSNQDHRRTDGVVQRREDNPVIEMENGVTWERLAVGDSTIADALIVTYGPSGSSSVEGKMMRHSGLEYGVILEGRLSLQLEFDTYELEPGDSLCFDSNRPHRYDNRTDQPARGIWFVIGGRESGHQSLADLGRDHLGAARSVGGVLDALRAMPASPATDRE
ncbi:cupin domain-containing protein [Agromyces sp. Marseille-P2726]|uniref:cupin domain-containing protein n=1 Tax=Agromyces sp. Marseille-P2726 TaxID=2709132 RepID=UPI00156F5690|nr:cupin domain-containing protein [Agromyces sp. Marseille-P2726]